mgnify:CR=1 FL=1
MGFISFVGKTLAMFPITLALSHFILGAFAVKELVTKVNKMSSAIVAFCLVANSMASMQVPLSVSLAFSANTINSSVGNEPSSNHWLMVTTFSFGFLDLSLEL